MTSKREELEEDLETLFTGADDGEKGAGYHPLLTFIQLHRHFLPLKRIVGIVIVAVGAAFLIEGSGGQVVVERALRHVIAVGVLFYGGLLLASFVPFMSLAMALAQAVGSGTSWMLVWTVGAAYFVPDEMADYFGLGLTVCFGITGAWGAWCFLMDLLQRDDETPEVTRELYRGLGLANRAAAAKAATEAVAEEGGPTILFGFQKLPYSISTQHFLFTGATGSGKTLLINALMTSAVGAALKVRRGRFVMYDPKHQLVPRLAHLLGGMRGISILNPFDSRSRPWDIARDIADEGSAGHFAASIVPVDGHQPFFPQAAQMCLTAVITGLQSLGIPWTLRDVCLICRDQELFEAFLKRSPSYAQVLQWVPAQNMYLSIRASLATALAPFQVVAAAWANATEKPFSVRDFFEGDGQVLLLGTHAEYDTQLKTLNRMIFRRLVEQLSLRPETYSGPEARYDFTWFFLDEFRTMDELPLIYKLLNEGRSKGGCVVLGFQDIAGLRDVYNENVANELCAQCSSQAMLRIGSSQTASWCSDFFGKPEFKEWSVTVNAGGSQSPRWSRTATIKEAPNVAPDMFRAIKQPKRGKPFTGFFYTPITGPYPGRTAADPYIDGVTTVDAQTPGLVRRPGAELSLRPFSPSELARLGLRSAAAPSATATSRERPGPLPPAATAPRVVPFRLQQKRSPPDDSPHGGLARVDVSRL